MKSSSDIVISPSLTFEDLKNEEGFDWGFHLFQLSRSCQLGVDGPGLCKGIALTGLFAFLHGDKAMQGFIDSLVAAGNMSKDEFSRAENILQATLKHHLRDELQKIEEEVSEGLMKRNPDLTKEKALELARARIEKDESIKAFKKERHQLINNHPFIKKYLDTMALLQNIKINHNVKRYAEFLPEGASLLRQYSMITEPARNDLLTKNQEMASHTSFSKPFSKVDLLEVLSNLVQVGNSLNERIGIVFNDPTHVFTCAYDPMNQEWLLFDSTQRPALKKMTSEEVMDFVWRGMEGGSKQYIVSTTNFVGTRTTCQKLKAQDIKLASALTLDEIISLPQQAKNEWLYEAAEKGEEEVFNILVNNGADVNVKVNDNLTPLWAAMNRGHFEMVQVLIQKKADPNILPTINDKKITVLMMAIDSKRIDLVQGLLANGADINAEDGQKKSPLFYAIYNRDTQMIKVLLEHGANVNAPDEKGISPIGQAVINDDVEMVKLLLTTKLDPAIVTNRIEVLLSAAKARGYKEIENVLSEAQAQDRSSKPLCGL